MNTSHPAPPATGLHIASYQIPENVVYGALAVAVLFILYCILTSRRVCGHLRRLGICLAVAAILSAAGVGYVDHARHARLVVASRTGTSVLQTLSYTWGTGTVIVAAVLFAVVTMVARRRAGVLGQVPRRRRRALPPPPGLDFGERG